MTSEIIKIPKDLGIKIGSEKEVFWTGVRDAAKDRVLESKQTIMLQSEVVILAENHIKKEKALNSIKK